jgi:squalene monooxygenase
MAQMNVDVLIAGGGVAGAATAAALAPLGLSVLIVEPRPAHGRRLAGELIHPPGIDGLRELGLLGEDFDLGSEIQGFAIFQYSPETPPRPLLLPYHEMRGFRNTGKAIEHEGLKDYLFERIKTFAGVEVWEGSRVVGAEKEADGRFSAVVRGDTGETRIATRLIIGADGPMSQVRKLAGIPHETHRYSGMMGAEVPDTHLPNTGYGHIFLNPAGISYGYSIGNGRARVMFEILKGDDPMESIAKHIAQFPAALRQDIEDALAADKPMAASNFRIVPDSSVKSNIALVGDARGCCHPVTASGITTAVKDALFLRDALRATGLDIPAALRRYSVMCGRQQLTRRTLSEELREAFLSHTPEATLLNQCIFSYWRMSARNRAHSLALLSTIDSSIFSMGVQFGLVVLQSFRLLPRWLREEPIGQWFLLIGKLFYKSLTFQQIAVRQWLKEQHALAK